LHEDAPALRAVAKLRVFFEAIKLSHSVFALPFAVAAAFMAAAGVPPLGVLGKIVLACVAARTAAMAFNRYLDAEIDARNPRTAGRAVPAGLLSRSSMGWAALASSALFAACAWWINDLALRLSPVALAVLLGYSWTKRFTSLSHLVLGAALGLSPLGAWIAVEERVTLEAVLLGLAVVFWTAGFDVIYACQDHDFDRANGLYSIPRRLGIAGSLWVSRAFHAAAASLLVALGLAAPYGGWYWAGVAWVTALLAYEQSLVRPGDLSRVDVAFFTLNGLVSLVFMASVVLETVV
jgi:4-hydroxybenzoate polyprenyltransferase